MSHGREQISNHVSLMKSLYDEALRWGEASLDSEGDELDEMSDRRHRILTRTRQMWEELESMGRELDSSPASQAFFQECKQSLKDLRPKFQEQDRRMQQKFAQRLAEIKRQMADSSLNLRAARSYAGLSRREIWH